MSSLRWKPILLGVLLAGVLVTACRSTFVVVPPSDGGYTAADTLRGWLRGEEVRVTFRVDTITRIRTITRVDTLYRDTLVQLDTVRLPVTGGRTRVDTVARVDTVILRPEMRPRTDTVVRVDTVRVPGGRLRVDTVRIAVTDTIRVPGKRLLFLPPGHFPPEGQCRVWIHGVPPGQQAAPVRCDAIRSVASGAFILFGGEAWDFDYDWIAEAMEDPDAVPPEIVAIKRRTGG